MNEYILLKTVELLTLAFELIIVYLYVSGSSERKHGHKFSHIFAYLLLGALLYGAGYVPITFAPFALATFMGVFLILRITDTGLIQNHTFRAMMFTAYMAMSELVVAGVIILIENV